ncbi:17580_t:CDS:2, partial [Gigaspora margarita]
MQSTQWVESTNRLIKSKVNTKTTLLNLLSKCIFESVQDAINKHLTLESASIQNNQISQSVLYHACLFEISSHLTLLPSAHESMDGYLEDEYDALQASLENIMNMVIKNNILE